MLMNRWEPVARMNRLQNEMSRWLDPWDIRSTRQTTNVFPLLILGEEEDHLIVEAELPGVAMNDLEIYVTGGNQLSIKGERKSPQLENGAWHRQERGFGAFGRLIELPCDVDADKVTASLSHGVLTIKLPKSEEAKPRKISVQAGE